MDDNGTIDTSFPEATAFEVVDAAAQSGDAAGAPGVDPVPDFLTTPERFLSQQAQRPSPLAGNGIGQGPLRFAEGISSPLAGDLVSFDPLAQMGGFASTATDSWLSFLDHRYEQLRRTYSWVDRIDLAFVPMELEESAGLSQGEEARRLKDEQARLEREKNAYVPWTLFGEEEERARQKPARPDARQQARQDLVRQRAEAALRAHQQQDEQTATRAAQAAQLRREREQAAQLADEQQRQSRLGEIAVREEQLRTQQETRRQQQFERLLAEEQRRDEAHERAATSRRLQRLVAMTSQVRDRGLSRWVGELAATARRSGAPLPEERLIAEAIQRVEQAQRQALAARTAPPAAAGAEQRERAGLRRQLERLAGLAHEVPDRALSGWVEELAARAADPAITPPEPALIAAAARRVEEARRQVQQARRELTSSAGVVAGAAPDAAQTTAALARLEALAAEIPDSDTRRWAESVAAAARAGSPAVDARAVAGVVARLEAARRQAERLRSEQQADGQQPLAARQQAGVQLGERAQRLAALASKLGDARLAGWARSLQTLAGDADAPLPPLRVVDEALRQAEQAQATGRTPAAATPGDRAATLRSIDRLDRVGRELGDAELARWTTSLRSLAADPEARLPEPAVIEEAIRRAEQSRQLTGEAQRVERERAAERVGALAAIERLAGLPGVQGSPSLRRWLDSLRTLAADPAAPLPPATAIEETIRRTTAAPTTSAAQPQARAELQQRATALRQLERLRELGEELGDPRLQRWVGELDRLAATDETPLPEARLLGETVRQLELAQRQREQRTAPPSAERRALLGRLEALTAEAERLPDRSVGSWLAALSGRVAADAGGLLPEAEVLELAQARLAQAQQRAWRQPAAGLGDEPAAGPDGQRQARLRRTPEQHRAAAGTGRGLLDERPGAGSDGAGRRGLSGLASSLRLLSRLGIGPTLGPAAEPELLRQRLATADLGRLESMGLLPGSRREATGRPDAARRSQPAGAALLGWDQLRAMGVQGWLGWPEADDRPSPANAAGRSGVWNPLVTLAAPSAGPAPSQLPDALHGMLPPGLALRLLDQPTRLEGPGSGRPASAGNLPLPELARWFRWTMPEEAEGRAPTSAGYLRWLDYNLAAEPGQAWRKMAALDQAVLPRIAGEPAGPGTSPSTQPAQGLRQQLGELQRSEASLGALLAERPELLDELQRTLRVGAEPAATLMPLAELLDQPVRALPAQLQRALGEVLSSPQGRQQTLRRLADQLPPGLRRAGSGATTFGSPMLDGRAPGVVGRLADGFRSVLLDEVARTLPTVLAERAGGFLPPGMVANLLGARELPAFEQQLQGLLAGLPADLGTAELGQMARQAAPGMAELLGRLLDGQGELQKAQAFADGLPSLGFAGFPFMPPLANAVDRRFEGGLARGATGPAAAGYQRLTSGSGAFIRIFGEQPPAGEGSQAAQASGQTGEAPDSSAAAADGARRAETRLLAGVLGRAGLPIRLAELLVAARQGEPAAVAPQASRLLLDVLRREQAQGGAAASRRVSQVLALLGQVPELARLSEQPAMARVLADFAAAETARAERAESFDWLPGGGLPGVGLLGGRSVGPAGQPQPQGGRSADLPGSGLAELLAARGERQQDIIRLDRFQSVSGAGQPAAASRLGSAGGAGAFVAPEAGGQPGGAAQGGAGSSAAPGATVAGMPAGGVVSRQQEVVQLDETLSEALGGRSLPQETVRRLQQLFPKGVPVGLVRQLADRYPDRAPSELALSRLVAELAAVRHGGPLGRTARTAEREALATQLAQRIGVGGAADLSLVFRTLEPSGRGLLGALQHSQYAWGGLSRELVSMAAGEETEATRRVLDRMLAGARRASADDGDHAQRAATLYTRPREAPALIESTRASELATARRRAAEQERDKHRQHAEHQEHAQSQRMNQRKSSLRRSIELAEALFPHHRNLSQFADAPGQRAAFPAVLEQPTPVDLTLVAPMAHEVELQAAPLYSRPQHDDGVQDSAEDEKRRGVLLGDKKMGMLDQFLSPDKIDDMATRLMLEVQFELLESNDIRGVQGVQGE